MDKYHAFELGLVFGRGLLFTKQTGAESLATDSQVRITVKQHGNDDVNNRYLENFSVLLKD